jgi:hypothetical protein
MPGPSERRRVRRAPSALELSRKCSFCPLGVFPLCSRVSWGEFGYGGDEAYTTVDQIASSASPATTGLTRRPRPL